MTFGRDRQTAEVNTGVEICVVNKVRYWLFVLQYVLKYHPLTWD